MPTASIPQKALESANPTAEIKVHQAVEVNVETDAKHNSSRNSAVENSAEIEFSNYKFEEFEHAEDDSMFGMSIWADVVEVEGAARRHSEWINNLEIRIKEVDSFLFGRRFRDVTRRMWRRPQCLRRLGRLRCTTCLGALGAEGATCTNALPAQRLTQMKYRNFLLWKVYCAHKHLRVSTLTLVKYVVSLISF